MKPTRILEIAIVSTLVTIATFSCRPDQSGKNSNKSTQHSISKLFSDSLPAPIGHVNDYEEIFSNEEKHIIDSMISDFEKRTTIEIALVTLDTTMTTADDLDALTLRIGNQWQIGQKDKNNGIVIGISTGYKKIRIENGYGIEKILTNEETKKIIDTAFIPGFRKARYFEGTLNGLAVLMRILKERYKQ